MIVELGTARQGQRVRKCAAYQRSFLKRTEKGTGWVTDRGFEGLDGGFTGPVQEGPGWPRAHATSMPLLLSKYIWWLWN